MNTMYANVRPTRWGLCSMDDLGAEAGSSCFGIKSTLSRASLYLKKHFPHIMCCVIYCLLCTILFSDSIVKDFKDIASPTRHTGSAWLGRCKGCAQRPTPSSLAFRLLALRVCNPHRQTVACSVVAQRRPNG